MTRDIPYPMPTTLRDNVNITLGNREMTGLGVEGRFAVRRLVAEAYARGFFDGSVDALAADRVDRQVEEEKKPKVDIGKLARS